MIAKGHQKNFETLLKAAANDDLCLLECTDDATGKSVIAICAVNHLPDGGVEMLPIAKMFDGNPFKELRPPQIDMSNVQVLQ